VSLLGLEQLFPPISARVLPVEELVDGVSDDPSDGVLGHARVRAHEYGRDQVQLAIRRLCARYVGWLRHVGLDQRRWAPEIKPQLQLEDRRKARSG